MTEENKNDRAEANSSSSLGTSEPQGRGVTLFETRAAPWLTCLEVDKLITFKRLYDRYARELAIATSTNGSGTKPYQMVDCVERKMLEIICKYGGTITASVSVDDITDDVFIQPLDQNLVCDVFHRNVGSYGSSIIANDFKHLSLDTINH